MADTQRPQSLSAFDDMVVQNKKRFDDLYRGGRAHAGEALTVQAAIGGERSKVAAAAIAAVELDPDSPAAQRLSARFGDDWRYEITEQQRVGDEAIVLCKLFLGKEGAVRMQFGRASFSEGPVAGASGSVRFKVGATDAGESDVFRRAAEAALINCIALI
jgi:hypothetical protein